MPSGKKVSNEVVEMVAKAGKGKRLRQIKEQFYYLSESSIYKILKEKKVNYLKAFSKNPDAKPSPRTIKKRKESEPSEFFKHEKIATI